MTAAVSVAPLRLLVVGERAAELAPAATDACAASDCHLAADLAGALDVLAARPIDAVICALDGAGGRRLFQIMQACYAGVWRVLVTDPAAKGADAQGAARLADTCVDGRDGAGVPAHLLSALRLSSRRA